MRRFLLFIGSMLVGTLTVAFLFAFWDPQAPRGPIILTWLIGLVFGLLFSAPFFVNPPDQVSIWSFRLPLVLWVFLIVVRLISWVGLMILWGIWLLIYLAWDPRQGRVTSRGPVNQNQPIGPPPGPGYQPPPPALHRSPPSWQPDPTGRYPMRYWDGTQWTDRVATGSMMSIDPAGAMP